MPRFAKTIRAGKVAVLVSPGYGAGWSSWNPGFPGIVFDPDVVAWVEGGKQEQSALEDKLEQKYGTRPYCGGLDQVEIHWLERGTRFRIDEYNGSESLVDDDDRTYRA